KSRQPPYRVCFTCDEKMIAIQSDNIAMIARAYGAIATSHQDHTPMWGLRLDQHGSRTAEVYRLVRKSRAKRKPGKHCGRREATHPSVYGHFIFSLWLTAGRDFR